MLKKLNLLIIILGSLLFIVGCSDSDNKQDPVDDPLRGRDGSTYNPNYPGNTVTPDPKLSLPKGDPGKCMPPGTIVNNKITPFYSVNIIGHGNFNETIAWSSLQMNEADRGIFLTDQKLKMRVVAKPNPGINNDYGCKYAHEYYRLGVSVSVKVEGGSTSQTRVFDRVQVDFEDNYGHCSEAKEFSMETLVTDKPLEVSIHSVFYDRCNNGYDAPNVDPSCPMVRMFTGACFQLELQVVTDHTRDF